MSYVDEYAGRQWILADAKKIVIDMPASTIKLPEAHIYDEPVRWYKANTEWTAIIEGIVSWLTETSAWPLAIDESYDGIQQISEFLNGVEPMSCCTPEQLAKLLALQAQGLLRGDAGSIVVDENGNVTVVDADSDESQVTALDSDITYFSADDATRSAHLGGIYRVIFELNNALAFGYDLVSNEPDNAEAEEAFFNRYDYTSSLLLHTWFDDTRFLADAVQITPAQADDIAEYVYSNDRTLYRRLVAIVPDVLSIPDASNVLLLLDALSQDELQRFYDAGLSQPRDDWRTYPVTPIRDNEETLTLIDVDASQVKRNSAIVYPSSTRLIRIDVSGSYTDEDGDVYDAFYRYPAGEAEPNAQLGLEFGTINVSNASRQAAVYNAPAPAPNHTYTIYVRMVFTSTLIYAYVDDNRGVTIDSPDDSVAFNVTFRDLGVTL